MGRKKSIEIVLAFSILIVTVAMVLSIPRMVNTKASNSTATKCKTTKNVYLTFDDGPSTNNTIKILKTLRKNDAHATFFVIGMYAKKHPGLVKMAYEQGNQIGIHTWSHNYKKIYSSREAFFRDFDKTEKLIIKITGEKPTVCRLPGGSNNAYLKRSMAVKIISRLRERGYTVVDWNTATNDAAGINYSVKQMANFAIRGIKKHKKPIVLSHDASWKGKTPAATTRVIKFCKKNKYECVTMAEYKGKVPLFLKI